MRGMGHVYEAGREPRIRYVADEPEVQSVARHCLRLGDFDRYVGVPVDRVDQLFGDRHDSYAKVFHARYADVEFHESPLAWTESRQHIEWWQREFGTEPPAPHPRLGVWVVGEPDPEQRLLWSEHQGPLESTTDLFNDSAGRWPRHLVVPEHLDPVSLDALISIIGGLRASTKDVWMYRRRAVVAALELRKRGLLDGGVVYDWVLGRGPLESVRRFASEAGLPPDWWWAEDTSWEVFSDDQSQVTFVGGTAELVEAVLMHPDLEGIEVRGDDRAYVESVRDIGGRDDR